MSSAGGLLTGVSDREGTARSIEQTLARLKEQAEAD